MQKTKTDKKKRQNKNMQIQHTIKKKKIHDLVHQIVSIICCN